MSKSDETASDEELGEQSTASVYDFLYNDSRRIGSYLAQLDENGLLTEIRRGEQVSKGGKASRSYGLTVLGTGGNYEKGSEEGGSETAERVYDPFWANALQLLDTLDELGMVHRGLDGAAIGGMVLVTGTMEVTDLGLLKEMWRLPTMQKIMRDGALKRSQAASTAMPPPNRHERRAQAKTLPAASPMSQEEQTVQLMLELMPVLPDSINIVVESEGKRVWANLQHENLIGLGSDLVLKHGRSVPGTWSILGIVDARPDLGGQGDLLANEAVNLGDPRHLLFNNLSAHFARAAAPMLRMVIGRPATHYGITPLLIFRDVGHAGI